jgi:Tol biopolymer transport system component
VKTLFVDSGYAGGCAQTVSQLDEVNVHVVRHPANKNVELRLVPAEGGESKTIVKLFGGQGTINVPSWSPDSENLVFPSQQESDRQWRVYRTRGLEIDRVRRHGGDILGRVPIWTANDRMVYWECPLDKCGLYIMRSDGTDPIRLTQGEHDTSPAASPDGSQIAYMSKQDGNWEIYVVGAQSPGEQEPRRLTKDGARDGLPVWSPDGKWLAFVTDRNGAWEVWVMRPDGSGQQKLFDLGGPLEGIVAYAPASEQYGWTWETMVWQP